MKRDIYNQRGQALITLLFFMVIAITITGAAVVVAIVSTRSTTRFEQSTRAYYIAESGTENALLRLLRDPSYTGETLPVSEGSTVITVTGTGPYTIVSQGIVGTYKRAIQVNAQFINSALTITSWKEI
jgi:hypothetical protein